MHRRDQGWHPALAAIEVGCRCLSAALQRRAAWRREEREQAGPHARQFVISWRDSAAATSACRDEPSGGREFRPVLVCLLPEFEEFRIPGHGRGAIGAHLRSTT